VVYTTPRLSPRVSIESTVRRLGDLGGELGADVGECGVDLASKCAHASRCTESDEGNNQRVLDQILSIFAQHLHSHFVVEIDQFGFHVSWSPLRVWVEVNRGLRTQANRAR